MWSYKTSNSEWGLLLLWRYSNCPTPSLCFYPLFEHLNSAPASIDTWCHGTRFSQLWMEYGLSGDTASGMEDDPGDPSATSVCVCVCLTVEALCSLFFWHRCPLFPPVTAKNTKDIVSAATKSSSFSGLLKPLFHHHLLIAWWRLWPLDKEGRSTVSRDWAMRFW